MRAKKWKLKTYIVLVLLVTSFIFAVSFSQGIEVAGQTLPTPTLTPTSTLNQTIEPVATPKLTSYSNVTSFAYSTIGNFCSENPVAKTITLCNYTSPSQSGKITKISIFLVGDSEVSHVKAVIFANEPNVDFPQGGEPIAQSFETFNVSPVSGQWYNFTMDYSASANTVYWLGYYSDNLTNYFFDESNSSITVTSQPKDGTSNWLPVGWSYQGKTSMSLDAQYAYTNPNSTIISAQPNPTVHQSNQSYNDWDPVFVLLIICGETVILLPVKHKRKTTSENEIYF